jgi:hypothetical protein
MPIHYVIDPQLRVIRETWTGEVTAADLGSYWRAYLADPQVLDIRTTLVDMRNARVGFTGDELRELIRSVVDPVLKGRPWLTAVIVDHPVQYGITRQYCVYAEHYSEDAIFSDCEAGMNWLLQQRLPQ